MKLSTICLVLLTASLFLTSCADNESSETPETNKYDAMAKELCTCMTPLSDLYKEVVAATEARDTLKVQSLVGDFERLSEAGESCAARLEAKYGNMNDPNTIEQAKAAVKKACPDIAAMMEGATQ